MFHINSKFLLLGAVEIDGNGGGVEVSRRKSRTVFSDLGGIVRVFTVILFPSEKPFLAREDQD